MFLTYRGRASWSFLVIEMADATIRPTAAALLLARGYDWVCPQCGELNLAGTALALEVCCAQCGKRCRVARVCHRAAGQPLAPGIAPQRFPGADAITFGPTSQGSVTLRALGYKWVCPECDPWGATPHFTACAFQDQVACSRCGARFAVGAIRHRLCEHDRAYDLAGHALSHPPEPAAFTNAEPSVRLALSPWDELFGGER